MTVSTRDGVSTLEISRPPANALDNRTLIALGDALCNLSAPSTRAVVLTAAGDRFFSAGGDIKELDTLDEQSGATRIEAFNRVLRHLDEAPWPVSCAVNGTAVGGGTEMVLFCDHAVGVRGSRFGLPELDHGLLPSAVSIARAVRRLGEPTARRLLLSARLVDADEAARIGLLDQVVDDAAQARRLAHGWAKAMASKPPVLLAAAKAVLRSGSLGHDELGELAERQFAEYFHDPEAAAARDRVLSRWRTDSMEPPA